MTAGIHTRDTLKQAWSEACSMADDIGRVATVELEASLKSFTSFCNAKGTEKKDKKECDMGKMVPMTKGKYKGTSDCVYNTHHHM